ncbi:hypothetical protein BC938DRAFT_479856 [Jimgerdemannia flammicorona]|uniref:Uncharacterized protein n=1 Tax=Jimgerdemannia flammicorona TaxID=994334 RepID=A0A433QJY4_9FUNG|nr:hypothetical protein BC938DRAFT_479856 [Jimgerdemannia flammicorona]
MGGVGYRPGQATPVKRVIVVLGSFLLRGVGIGVRNSGVNFHPSEFAFMNLSARASYPSASTTFRSFTPSTKSHFKLKENTNATISREDRLAKLRKLAGPEHRTSSAGLPGAVGSSGLSRHALLQQAPAPGAGALFINRPQVQRKQSLPNFLRASVPPKVSPINTQPKVYAPQLKHSPKQTASIAQALTSPSINSSSFFGTQPMAVDGQGSPSTISPTLPGSSTTTTVAAGSAVVGSGSGNRPRGFIKPTKVQILDFEATKQLLNESQSTMDKIAHDEQQQKEAKRKEAKDRTEEKRRAEEEKKREREREREERKERKRAAEEETRRTRERERGEREEREREREMVREMEREERDREIEEADPDEAEKEREKEREREDDGEKGRKRRRSSGTSSKKSVSRDALMISDGEIEDDGQPGSSTVPLHPLAIPVSTNSNSFVSELTASPTSAYPVANAATTRIITDTAVPEPSLPTDLSMPVGYASFIAPNGVMPELPLLAMQADINAQVFERTNKLSEEGRAMITDFLAGKISEYFGLWKWYLSTRHLPYASRPHERGGPARSRQSGAPLDRNDRIRDELRQRVVEEDPKEEGDEGEVGRFSEHERGNPGQRKRAAPGRYERSDRVVSREDGKLRR